MQHQGYRRTETTPFFLLLFYQPTGPLMLVTLTTLPLKLKTKHHEKDCSARLYTVYSKRSKTSTSELQPLNSGTVDLQHPFAVTDAFFHCHPYCVVCTPLSTSVLEKSGRSEISTTSTCPWTISCHFADISNCNNRPGRNTEHYIFGPSSAGPSRLIARDEKVVDKQQITPLSTPIWNPQKLGAILPGCRWWGSPVDHTKMHFGTSSQWKYVPRWFG